MNFLTIPINGIYLSRQNCGCPLILTMDDSSIKKISQRLSILKRDKDIENSKTKINSRLVRDLESLITINKIMLKSLLQPEISRRYIQ